MNKPWHERNVAAVTWPAAYGGRILAADAGDNGIRCAAGTRFERLFEAHCRTLGAAAEVKPAVDCGGVQTTYAELERLANRLARHLKARGVAAGDRVAILLKGTPETYAAMLAVLKAGAVFVPIDAAFTRSRIAFILADAGARFAVVTSDAVELMPEVGVTLVVADCEAGEIAARSAAPVRDATTTPADDLCYIIYTSGTTGNPKGVQIDHLMLCNFVLVARESYRLPDGARMYQGLTIAFDFAVEEIWVALFSGATLVPPPAGGNLVGADLAKFLREARVTAFCCVPTLLATIQEDLPDLGFLLVSGEACPADLIGKWWREDRLLLNAYGPTETTVTATLGWPRPGRPVTIGKPLPTYFVAIRDPDTGDFLGPGETGEIILGGAGLSRGYLNRPDLTERAFIEDPFGLPSNPTGRLYRTGDLGRVTVDGEVECLGRIDSQVKIRGYRIELAEIEAILLRAPGVIQAVAGKVEKERNIPELAAWYVARQDAPEASVHAVHAQLKEHLPGFMVPAYLQRVDSIPMLPSGKADHRSLPEPDSRIIANGGDHHEPPRTETEHQVAAAVTRIAGIASPSVTGHFFDNLGLNSLLVARLAAELRRVWPDGTVAMKDFYLRPTVRGIAAMLDGQLARTSKATRRLAPHRATDLAYWATGVAQVVSGLLYSWATLSLTFVAMYWVAGGADLLAVYLRALAAGGGLFLLMVAVPVALKWLLIGRFKPTLIPIWSAAYFRFWFVKGLIRNNPMLLFAGTPLYNVYLRLLGARIGADVQILTGFIPVCPDLLDIGDRAIVNRGVLATGYRAEAGWIETGPIRIGAGASVGEASVLDIDTTIGDGAALAHASSLHRGQSIPDGQSWHGSPGQIATHDYRADTREAPSRWRKWGFVAFQLGTTFAIGLPMSFVVVVLLDWLGNDGANTLDPFTVFGNPVVASLGVYFGLLLLSLASVFTLPRLATKFLATDRTYPLYGLRHALARWLETAANSIGHNLLFGDSTYVLGYWRRVGLDVSTAPGSQTGSNFGLLQKFGIPAFCRIGPGTMASDGLTVVNHVHTSSSIRLLQATIGARNFIGNVVLFPPGARIGDNCLVATKAFVPLDGPMREGAGLLGSPSFEVPRSVRRDQSFDHYRDPAVLGERLALKNRSNLATMALHLTSRWFSFLLFWLGAMLAFDLYPTLGALVVPLIGLGLFALVLLQFVAIEHATAGWRGHEPHYCSIYDEYYWRHERYWKLADPDVISAFNGTPFKGPAWRLLGVKIGKKVYDDGATITERTLTEIGDYVTLNAESALQAHSLEDGTFKSDYLRVETGATIAPRCYVHYATTIGEGAVVEADSFLMKGETVGAGEVWGGNPAKRLSK